MLQMDFAFFNVEIIRGFTSTVVAICSTTSYHFVFLSRSKFPPLDSLKYLFSTLRKQDKKVAFLRVYKYRALKISSKFMRTHNNMNIIVQTTGGYASLLNGKNKIPNNTFSDITRAFIINSNQNKLIWLFAYQYAIWISRKNDNILRGDVTCFLWYRSIPSYKLIKIWDVRVYIINGRVTIINIYDRSHHGYSMGYAATTGVIIYWNLEHTFVIHINHHAWLDKIIIVSP